MTRSLDRLVAENVFGWKVIDKDEAVRRSTDLQALRTDSAGIMRCDFSIRYSHGLYVDKGKPPFADEFDSLPMFRLLISEAWAVLEALRAQDWSFIIYDLKDSGYYVSFDNGYKYPLPGASHESITTAICLAALRAKGVPEAEILKALATKPS